MAPRRSCPLLALLSVVVAALCACGKAAAPPAAAAAAAKAPTRIGLSLVDAADARADAVKFAAAAAQVDLRVQCANGRFATQSNQVLALLDEKVGALLLVPSSPDLLHSIAALAAAQKVPLVTIGRGDATVGGWVGLKSETLAREAGEAAGRVLRDAGITRPRVVAVETSRWPETTRRNEAVLQALQKEFGSLDLPIRLQSCETALETQELLVDGLPRLISVDAIITAEPATTAGAWAALQGLPTLTKTLLIGPSDDEKLVAAARAADSRLVLVTWKPADLAAKAIGAALRAVKGEERPVDEVAAELVGAGTGGR